MSPAAFLVAFMANPAVHVADQLLDKRKSEPLTAWLAGYERLENMVAQAGIDPFPIVAHADFDRKLHRPPEPNDIGDEAADKSCANNDLRRDIRRSRIAPIGKQVYQHLHQCPLAGEYWR